MKRSMLVLLCFAVALLGASSALAYTIGNGVPGSPHDLHATYPSATSTTEVCIFCHTPHNSYRLDASNGGAAGGAGPVAPAEFNYLPLWNHTLPNPTPTYSLYYNGPGAPQVASDPKASQAVILTSGATAPGGTSLLCLSCHDGKISVNSYGNTNQPASAQSYVGNVGGTKINGNFVIGQDYNLQNHHPIAFSMDLVRSLGDTAIDNPDTILYNSGGDTVRNHLYGGTSCAGTNCMVECGTCHSVHNTGNSGETLLWTTNAGSGMCLTCHIKGPLPTPGTVTAVR